MVKISGAVKGFGKKYDSPAVCGSPGGREGRGAGGGAGRERGAPYGFANPVFQPADVGRSAGMPRRCKARGGPARKIPGISDEFHMIFGRILQSTLDKIRAVVL